MPIRHVAVWLDHEEARVFYVDPKSFVRSDVHITHHLCHPDKKGGTAELHRSAAEDHPFFEDIVKHLGDAAEILVLGPADTKLAFVKFMRRRHKSLSRNIVGVEPSDHPTDGQLVAHVRKCFLEADRLRG